MYTSAELWSAGLVGFLLGLVVVAAPVLFLVMTRSKKAREVAQRAAPVVVVALVLVVMLAPQFVTLAQETPVPLVIPTNQIFTQTNNWIQQFAPIAAIGIGAGIAIAILGFVGKTILSAFR